MVAKKFSDIVQRCIMKEINKVIAKYSKVSNENKDFDNTLEISKDIKEEICRRQSRYNFYVSRNKR